MARSGRKNPAPERVAKQRKASIAKHREPPEDPSPYVEVGASGLVQYGGYVREEFHRDLEGPKAARVYTEMSLNDAGVGAAILAIETLIRRVSWTTNAAKDSGAAGEAIAQKIEECRTDMDVRWTNFISDALSMVVYGFAPAEIVYKIRRGDARDVEGKPIPQLHSKYDDGWIGWRGLMPRKQESVDRWSFDDHGRWTGLFQRPAPDFRERHISRDRLLLFRPRAPADNPEGRSLLRPAYRSHYFLKHFQEIEGVGVERRVVGLPKMEVPLEVANDPSGSVYGQYKTLVEAVRRDKYSGIVVPCETNKEGATGYKFSLVTTGGDSPSDLDPIIKRYESRILMAFLAEFIMLGMDKVGSFALSSDKTDLFAMVIETYLQVIQEELNDVAIPRLCRLNGVPPALYPSFAYGDLEKTDVAQLVQSLVALLGAGAITGGPKLARWILEQVGAPIDETIELPSRIEPDTETTIEPTVAEQSAA